MLWWFSSAGMALWAATAVALTPRVLNPKVTKGTLVALELAPGFEGEVRVGAHRATVIEDQGRRLALFGIPYNVEGLEPWRLTLKPRVGEVQTLEIPLEAADYPSETLTVSPRHVKPSAKDQARIEREKKEVGAVYASYTPERLWREPFALPVNSEMTSVYGTQRVFNGELQSYHNGIDFRAKTGRRIRASAAGRVALAKYLFYTGNTVILDHGLGVLTLYAHLSRLDVKKGQRVQRRQVLGLAGQTGRANGPHLHFTTIVNNVRVNPQDLFTYLGDQTAPPQLLKTQDPSSLGGDAPRRDDPTSSGIVEPRGPRGPVGDSPQ